MGQAWQTWFFQFLMVPVLFLSSLIKSSCCNSLDKIIWRFTDFLEYNRSNIFL